MNHLYAPYLNLHENPYLLHRSSFYGDRWRYFWHNFCLDGVIEVHARGRTQRYEKAIADGRIPALMSWVFTPPPTDRIDCDGMAGSQICSCPFPDIGM